MNNQGKYEEDLLKQYINPDRIEKAPEGFTSKIMTNIQIETASIMSTGRFRSKSPVPVISAAVTILLIVASLILPGNESDSLALPVIKFFNNIKVSFPEIDLSSVFKFNLPALLIYVFVGILILTLFDKALNVLFHREK